MNRTNEEMEEPFALNFQMKQDNLYQNAMVQAFNPRAHGIQRPNKFQLHEGG